MDIINSLSYIVLVSYILNALVPIMLCSQNGQRMRNKQELTVRGRQPIIPPFHGSKLHGVNVDTPGD